MSNPYIGEVRIFGFNFAPRGWAQCNGQLLSISQNTALFSILGTYYGGNGQSTFGLPNFEGSVALGQGSGAGLQTYSLGESAGSQSVTVLMSEMPSHTHTMQGLEGRGLTAHATPVAGDALITSSGGSAYAPGSPNVQMLPQSVTVAGGSQPHNNMMPSLVLNYCICMQGVFPARN